MNFGNTVILTFGDKLKAIRAKYDLRQDEISGQDITRNLISEIETNKANITKKTAEIIIKNLNEMAKKKHFKITETMEYLLESELEQANKVLDKHINELKTLIVCKDDSFVKELKETEEFLINWDIRDKKIIVYELAGDYFFNQNEMHKSVSYYERALELTNKISLSQSLLTLLRKLSAMYIYIGNYNESIKCCEFALERFDDMTKENTIVFRHNNSLNYKKLNNYKKALDNIKKAEELLDKTDLEKVFNVLNNKAVCLYEMNLKEESLKVFNEILDLIKKNDMEKYVIISTNIINIYLDINLKDKAIENLNFVTDYLKNLNNDSLSIANIYFEIGKIYKKLNEENLSEDYCLKSLDLAEKQKNYVLSNNVLCDLIEMYAITNNVEKMNNVKEKTLFILTKQEKINHNLIYKLISFYNRKNSDVVEEIINFVSKFK
ncbi:helix-turn-helix domain-containing protein [Clostridium hydrogenum]|uniref:helix-turn-helix domain-containing protein n=1 Tax=Clostridium hydrogenum TaxID=2855764 RepID=UPI001F17F1ED|nr:helix-turn-helix transcriptional regulator [Clostridium hydrogenum]